MIFYPYILNQDKQIVPVTISPATESDLDTQRAKPYWQTDWKSEYLSNPNFSIYAVKTTLGELVALGAYQYLEYSLIVRIVYMEGQPESNSTITSEPNHRKYTGIGRVLLAQGIKLSVDHDFGGDITFEAKTTSLAHHYEFDYGAVRLPSFDTVSAPRFLLSGKPAQVIFSAFLREE